MRIIAGAPDVVEFVEWETATLPARFELTERDRVLAGSLSDTDGNLLVEELRTGVRVRSSSWIGVVRFEGFEVRVVPKLVGGNLGVLEMLEYASGLDALARLRGVRELATSAEGRLVDLLALLLAEASERVLREGLLADYVTHEEPLELLRGRLLVTEQVVKRFGRLDRLECRYDELETDIMENRLVTVALGLARRVCHDPEIRRRVSRLHAVFVEACDPGAFDHARARRLLHYHRRNEHYRTAHGLSWLFIDRLAIQDLFSPGGGRSFAFLFDMNRLFERFVSRLLSDGLADTDVRVHSQRRDRSIILDDGTGRPYASVIPDVLLERRDEDGLRRVPLDTKYRLYDDRSLATSDVYQTFLYGYAYARTADVATDGVVAFILYPGAAAGRGSRLRVVGRDGVTAARIRALPIDVPSTLRAIREDSVAEIPTLASLRGFIAGRPLPGDTVDQEPLAALRAH